MSRHMFTLWGSKCRFMPCLLHVIRKSASSWLKVEIKLVKSCNYTLLSNIIFSFLLSGGLNMDQYDNDFFYTVEFTLRNLLGTW